MINKIRKMLKNDKKTLKLINKLDNKLFDVLILLYNVEEKTDYKIKDLDKAINILQNI